MLSTDFEEQRRLVDFELERVWSPFVEFMKDNYPDTYWVVQGLHFTKMFEARNRLRADAQELYRQQQFFGSMNRYASGNLQKPSDQYVAQQRLVERLAASVASRTERLHAYEELLG